MTLETSKNRGRSNAATHDLDATDLAIIDLVRSGVDVGERSDADRRAFAARVIDRVESRKPWLRPARFGAVGVAAAAAAALWLTVWPGLPLDPNGGLAIDAVPASGSSFLSTAYYDDFETGMDSELGENSYLPDRYRAWSDALDVDGATAVDVENGTSWLPSTERRLVGSIKHT